MTATMDPHGPIPASGIETLADRAAICELAKVYALGIDSRDEAMVRSYEATMHNITNQYATVDGDEAEVWSYAVAIHLGAPGTDQTDLTMGVQYRDRCSRTADGWLISGRETVKLWARGPLPQ